MNIRERGEKEREWKDRQVLGRAKKDSGRKTNGRDKWVDVTPRRKEM